MGPTGAIVSLLLLALVLDVQAALPLPDYVRKCSVKLSDKKLSECETEHAREVIPHVLKGDPKYDVPVLDPLHVDELVVIDGNGPLGLQLISTDVNLYGLPNVIINDVLHQSEPLENTFVITIPEARAHAKYNITGRILLLPINGRGNSVLKFKNLKITYQFNPKLTKLEDGEIYYLPQPGARLDAEVDGMSVELDNLFNGDKMATEAANKVINDNWKDVFHSLQPSFGAAINKIITRILTGIFKKVPYKEAFSDTGL